MNPACEPRGHNEFTQDWSDLSKSQPHVFLVALYNASSTAAKQKVHSSRPTRGSQQHQRSKTLPLEHAARKCGLDTLCGGLTCFWLPNVSCLSLFFYSPLASLAIQKQHDECNDNNENQPPQV